LQNSKIERKSYQWGRAYEVTRDNHPKLILPSVTTVLKLVTEPKFKHLREKFGEARWQKILDDASYRGTVMHSMLENFLLEFSTVLKRCGKRSSAIFIRTGSCCELVQIF
jgi:hypothetical protein